MALNPRAKNYRVLGLTLGQWDAAKAAVTAFLDLNDDKEELAEAAVRAALPAAVSDRAWNELKRELGL